MQADKLSNLQKDKNIDEVYKIEINHKQSTPNEYIMYNYWKVKACSRLHPQICEISCTN